MQNRDLQEKVLTSLSKTHMNVTVFLMNGFQMHGVITGYDNFVVLLDSDGKQQMIYKHAISTIIPARPFDLSQENE